jgi:RimJ/RimL family protein N-acetyltransferase
MTTATEPIINILGDRVALGPMRRELMDDYLRWNNDFAVLRTTTVPGPLTREALVARFERTSTADNIIAFTIYARFDPAHEQSGGAGTGGVWSPIGTTALVSVNWRDRTAEYAIIIGEASARGRGYGTEVTRLMLDYAFTALGLRSLMLCVTAYNLAGAAAYHKAGFREFGRRREEVWMGGRFWDTVYMDCLASEFVSPVLGEIFAPDPPRSARAGVAKLEGPTPTRYPYNARLRSSSERWCRGRRASPSPRAMVERPTNSDAGIRIGFAV